MRSRRAARPPRLRELFAAVASAAAAAAAWSAASRSRGSCSFTLCSPWTAPSQKLGCGPCDVQSWNARRRQQARCTMGAEARPSTRGLPLDLRGTDITKRPVQLLHPSKVQKGRPRARWQDTFRVWRREIPKPDFNILHAAKAVRLLPKLTFRTMPADQPVFLELMNRTKDLLRQGQAGGKEVGAMVRACAKLREDLPQLQAELLPILTSVLPGTIGEMSAVDLSNLLLAAHKLKNDLPELWKVAASKVDVIANEVGELDIRDLAPLTTVIRTVPDEEEGKAACALQALQQRAMEDLEDLRLPEVAQLLWGLEDAVDARLLAAVSQRVVERALTWNKEWIDPGLWQISCAYAKLGERSAPVLKAVARRALSEGLDGLSGWSVAGLTWAYGKLGVEGDGLADFRRHLAREVELRELSQHLIGQSHLGPDGGGNATLAALWSKQQPRRRERPARLAPRPSLGLAKLLAS